MPMAPLVSAISAALLLLLPAPPPVPRGDDPPPGLTWIRTCAEARRDALQHARPVFVYFTKTY